MGKFNEMLRNTSTPLFQIETILAVPEIALHVNPKDMKKIFTQTALDCIEA